MKARTLKLVIAIAVFWTINPAKAIENNAQQVPQGTLRGLRHLARAFSGRDVHIRGQNLQSYHAETGEDILVVEKDFEITAGADTFSGDKAVVWMKRKSDNGKGTDVWCCISGKVTAKRSTGTRIAGLNWEMSAKGPASLLARAEAGETSLGGVESRRAMRAACLTAVVWFKATGEVFVTAGKRESGDVRGTDFYTGAFETVSGVDKDFAGHLAAVAPKRPEPGQEPNTAKQTEPRQEKTRPRAKPAVEGEQKTGVFGFIDRLLGTSRKREAGKAAALPEEKVRYPVNLAPAGETEPNVEWGLSRDAEIATIIGRFYLWQKQDERGRLLELQADAAVVFYTTSGGSDDNETVQLPRLRLGQARSPQAESIQDAQHALQHLGGKGAIQAVYVCGDVVMTEGLRTIRADEMYYDFAAKKGIAINATLRTLDPGRGIPIYIRAAKVRQLAQGKFAAENVTLTTSEFHVPQISLEASNILVTDSTTIDAEQEQVKDSSYDVAMQDVRLKAGETTLLRWPFIRSDLERPDVPFKHVRLGHDNIMGTSVETQWYLSRLLGLQEPDGTDGTFELDYFDKRGLGSGIDVDYAQHDHLGNIIGYIIDDRGEDRLGRAPFRRNLEPPEKLRGRFGWFHREFMPYNWQVTLGINYESDENFVESFYRREFNTGPDRETYIHLKRNEDNWGLSLLGKGRLNDFADELEEYPTGEYHLTGQSFLDDKLTLYSDTQGGVYRQRIGDWHTTAMNEDAFAFGSHRTEIDAPVWMSGIKATPFVAGTVGYDDRSGFNRSLVDGSNSGEENEDVVGIGEAGIRASSEFWKVYRGARSRLLDLDGLRHIVRPEMAASVYADSDTVVRQHDVVHIGLSQRLQTKRGPENNQRTVDWMRLDLGATWFDDADNRTEGSAPARFIWNRPMTPLRLFTMPGILNGDLQQGLKKFETYGPKRNYFSADYAWQITDTTALLGDAYYDVGEGTFEQVDVGFSRMRFDDMSYYIGSRYLRNVRVLDEKGSNAFVFSASYILDERYTVIFSQQFDFDYGANVESDITLVRRYHRIFWSLTFSADGSLDRQAVVFSIWPEGVPELALGSRRYTGLAAPGGY